MWPLSPRGGGGKALVAWPLKKRFFCGFPYLGARGEARLARADQAHDQSLNLNGKMFYRTVQNSTAHGGSPTAM